MDRLPDNDDGHGVLAKTFMLSEHGLETACRLKLCKYPMRYTKGLLEIRKGGARFYGGRLGLEDGRELIVLLGAEHKDRKDEADKALLARCSKELAELTNIKDEINRSGHGK